VFQQIFHFFQKRQTITLSSEALDRLEQESQKRGIKLHLEVKILRETGGRGQIQVGFTKEEDLSKYHPIFGHLISDEDFQSLAGGEITYSKEEGRYQYYPNVDLEWEDTPRELIKRIKANRSFTKQNQVWTSEMGTKFEPIQYILKKKEIISCYAKGNKLQIEFLNFPIPESLMEDISESILIYFAYLYPHLCESSHNRQ